MALGQSKKGRLTQRMGKTIIYKQLPALQSDFTTDAPHSPVGFIDFPYPAGCMPMRRLWACRITSNQTVIRALHAKRLL